MAIRFYSYWRDMEGGEFSKRGRQIYRLCPPWALEPAFCHHRLVSLTGRVTHNTDHNSFRIMLDDISHTQATVILEPFDFRFMFFPKAFGALMNQDENIEGIEHRLRGPNWDRQKEEWAFVPAHQRRAVLDGSIHNNIIEPQKRINPTYFEVGHHYELRGKMIKENTLLLDDFTPIGADFDLFSFNQALRSMISQSSHNYY